MIAALCIALTLYLGIGLGWALTCLAARLFEPPPHPWQVLGWPKALAGLLVTWLLWPGSVRLFWRGGE